MIPSRKRLDLLAVRVDRVERRRPVRFELDPVSVARMSLMLGGPGGVSAEHRELLQTDPEARPKPAAVAGLLTMVTGRPYSPEAADEWIQALLDGLDDVPAPQRSLVDLASGAKEA